LITGRRILILVVVLALAGSACSTGGSGRADAEALVGAMTDSLTGGGVPLTDQEAECVARGTVDLIGAPELEALGITADDPTPVDPYVGLSDSGLEGLVDVWEGCVDVPDFVRRAILDNRVGDTSPALEQCVTEALVGERPRAFLTEVLGGPGRSGGLTDMVRVLDGCGAGAEDPAVAALDPRLWPFLAVAPPGFRIQPSDLAGAPSDGAAPEDKAARLIRAAGEAGIALTEATARILSGPGDPAAALAWVYREGAGEGEDPIALMAVVATEPGTSPGPAAVIVPTDTEVFDIVLPGGAATRGWEYPDTSITLYWEGQFVAVAVAGGVEAPDFLTSYADLAPSPG